jgi:hypothetical protein
LLAVLEDFLETTRPAHVPEERWRELLINAAPERLENLNRGEPQKRPVAR